MATEKQFDDEEEQPSTSSEPLEASSAPLANANQQSAPAASPTGTPSGRPNIKQYMNANQGAGEQLSQGIQNRFQKDVNNFEGNVNTTGQQVDQSNTQYNQKLGADADTQIQTAFKDPKAILANQQQLAEFNKLKSGGYQSDIQGLGQQFNQQKAGLQGQLGMLGDQANLARSEGGRFQLLQQAFNQPNYTRGQKKLDQLFLQTQPGAQQGLQTELQKKQAQAGQRLNDLDTQTQAKLTALQGLSDQKAQKINNVFHKGTDESGLETNIGDRGLDDIATSSAQQYAQAQARAAAANGLQDRLADPTKLTMDDVRNVSGSTDAWYNPRYDLDLNGLVKDVNLNPTQVGATNAEEVARYRALLQLAGEGEQDIFGTAPTEEAGKYTPYQVTGDLNQMLADKRREWEQAKLAETLNQLKQNQTKFFYGGAANQFGGYGNNLPTNQLANLDYSQDNQTLMRQIQGADSYSDLPKFLDRERSIQNAYNSILNSDTADNLQKNIDAFQSAYGTGDGNYLGRTSSSYISPQMSYLSSLYDQRKNRIGPSLDPVMQAVIDSGFVPSGGPGKGVMPPDEMNGIDPLTGKKVPI